MSDCGELSLLLITANVGTLFEQPDRLLTPWLDQFCSKVSREQPDFVALHCQEVGGKTFVTGMKHVQPFVDTLLEAPELSEYSRIRGFFDEDYETKTEFTALGSVYLVHSRVSDAAMWDFSGSRFHPIADKEIKVENVQQDPFHKKLKYPPDFFPQFPWSRKGHIITRWRLRNRILDMVNVHLFHDASNLESVSQSPSIYVANRCRALKHTMQKLSDLDLAQAPLFIFGDFNFRLDMKSVADDHFEGCTARPVEKDSVVTSVSYYKEDEETPVLTLEKKGFVCREPLSQTELMEWRRFDRELGQFPDLSEQKITFPPSYPFSEDEGVTSEYMQTRPPSWCDRVLYNNCGKQILDKCSPVYGLVGTDAEMGDHKPVFMSAVLPAVMSTSSSTSVSTGNSTSSQNSTSEKSTDESSSRRSSDKSTAGGSSDDTEPAAKRVPHSPIGNNLQDLLASCGGQLLLAHWPLLALALIYCCTLLLLQYTVDVDCASALVILIVLAAAISLTLSRR